MTLLNVAADMLIEQKIKEMLYDRYLDDSPIEDIKSAEVFKADILPKHITRADFDGVIDSFADVESDSIRFGFFKGVEYALKMFKGGTR